MCILFENSASQVEVTENLTPLILFKFRVLRITFVLRGNIKVYLDFPHQSKTQLVPYLEALVVSTSQNSKPTDHFFI